MILTNMPKNGKTPMNQSCKVYVGGTFDLFHWGHVEFLKKCSDMGNVIVSLNTDKFCEEYKHKPILTYNERKKVLLGCHYVYAVIENTGGYDSKPAIVSVKPDYIVHGDDWKGNAYLKQLGIDKEFLKQHRIKLKYVPYTKGISTTEIIKRFK